MDKIVKNIVSDTPVTVFNGDRLSVVRHCGYEYVHKNNGRYSTAIVPYETDSDGNISFVYLNKEPRIPQFGNMQLAPSCVTGTIEKDEDAFGNAKKELGEEVGFYYVPDENWKYVGEFWNEKSSDSICYGFGVNVEGAKRSTASGDGSKMEELSYPVKVTLKEAIETVKDSIFHAILLKLSV